ncbi:uncharacterized protein VTP21DRAFT_6427 [Calcarisporiella thermophila]|uniref:uncharacterized protein n=1 Tax=Calcarisporiella thermophila TaxID=911321 RepID=UPI0037440145
MNEQLQAFIDGPRQFVKEGVQFINRCTKPDRKEFMKISQAVAIGFCLAGFLGYIIKLIHIPINNILVGGA